MARRAVIEIADDGSATIGSLKVGPATWTLISRYAAHLGLAEADAARVLFHQFDALIAAGSVSWLSADWQALLKAPAEPPKFIGDMSRLHRSDRVKSGYRGVYANGQGFRATGRNGEYLATCSTPEEAAWRRYQHYMQHGLPYGELEVAVDDARKAGEIGTDEALRRIVLETAKLTNTLHVFRPYMNEQELMAFVGEAPDVPETKMLGFAPGELEAASAALGKVDEAGGSSTLNKRKG